MSVLLLVHKIIFTRISQFSKLSRRTTKSWGGQLQFDRSFHFATGNRMLLGSRGEGTGMTFKQELNQTRNFQRGREKEDNTKIRIKYSKIST